MLYIKRYREFHVEKLTFKGILHVQDFVQNFFFVYPQNNITRKVRYNLICEHSSIKFRAPKSYVSQHCDNRAVLMSRELRRARG